MVEISYPVGDQYKFNLLNVFGNKIEIGQFNKPFEIGEITEFCVEFI